MPQLEARGSQKVRKLQEGQNNGALGTEASPGGEGGRPATGSGIISHEFSQTVWACLSVDVVVQALSRVQLSAPPRTTARQASFSVTISWSLLKSCH